MIICLHERPPARHQSQQTLITKNYFTCPFVHLTPMCQSPAFSVARFSVSPHISDLEVPVISDNHQSLEIQGRHQMNKIFEQVACEYLWGTGWLASESVNVFDYVSTQKHNLISPEDFFMIQPTLKKEMRKFFHDICPSCSDHLGLSHMFTLLSYPHNAYNIILLNSCLCFGAHFCVV